MQYGEKKKKGKKDLETWRIGGVGLTNISWNFRWEGESRVEAISDENTVFHN